MILKKRFVVENIPRCLVDVLPIQLVSSVGIVGAMIASPGFFGVEDFPEFIGAAKYSFRILSRCLARGAPDHVMIDSFINS